MSIFPVMRRNEESGFTLVELLVTMMIIGLLAAIAIPAFLKQKDTAYRTAMKADLHGIVLSETSYSLESQAYTTDLTVLQTEGYKASDGVTAHVALVGAGFVACTRHSAASEWLVYDSATGAMTTSGTDCV